MIAKRLILGIIILVFISSVYSQCIPTSPEIPDNFIDEDCDGWITRTDYSIRSEHPRLLITRDMIPVLIERVNNRDAQWFNYFLSDMQTKSYLNHSYLWAFLYLVTGNTTYGQYAVDKLCEESSGSYGGTAILRALAYDWLRGADEYWNKNVFSDYQNLGQQCVLPYVGTEDYWMREPEDGWYPAYYYWATPHAQYDGWPGNSGSARIFGSFFPAFALAGDGIEEEKIGNEISTIKRYFEKTYLPDRNMWEGVYPNGMTRENYQWWQFMYVLEAIRTATGVDLFPKAEYAKRYVEDKLYCSVPHTVNYRRGGYGIPDSNIGICESLDTSLYRSQLLYHSFLALLANRYQNPLYQWLYEQSSQCGGEIGACFEWRFTGYAWSNNFPYIHRIIFWNDSLHFTSIQEYGLPLALYEGDYSRRHPDDVINESYRSIHGNFTYLEGAGHIYMRSSWTDPNATFAMFQAGDFLGGEQHSDNLAFTIHRNGYLALDAGLPHDGWWGGKPIPNQLLWWGINYGHNIPLISDPTEAFRGRTNWPSCDSSGRINNYERISYVNDILPNWEGQLKRSGYEKRAEIKAFEHNREYTYAYGDATMSYLSPQNDAFHWTDVLSAACTDHYKVTQVEREFVYLRSENGDGDYFIVFDRINETPETFNLNYPNSSKKFVLHIENEPRIWNGSGWELPESGIREYKGDLWYSLGAGKVPGSSSNSKLFGKTLLPENHKYRIVGGIGGTTIPSRNIIPGTYPINYWAGESNDPLDKYTTYNVIPYIDPVIGKPNLGLSITPPGPVLSGKPHGQNWTVTVDNNGLSIEWNGTQEYYFDFDEYPTIESIVNEINSWSSCPQMRQGNNDWAAMINYGYQFWLDDWGPGDWGEPMGGNAFKSKNLQLGVYGENGASVGDMLAHRQILGLWRIEVIPDGEDVKQFNNFLHVLYPTDAYSFIIDDGDDGFSVDGQWEIAEIPASTCPRSDFYYGRSFFYNSKTHYSDPGTGSNKAVWSFNITQEGNYEIFGWWNINTNGMATWTSFDNIATNAPYTINHAEGLTTVRVDQKNNPRRWYLIGKFHFTPGRWNVTLSNDANGIVVADAIRIAQVSGDGWIDIPEIYLIESSDKLMKGSFIEKAGTEPNKVVMFSTTGEEINQTQYTLNGSGPVRNLVLDLKPLTTFNIYDNGEKIYTLISSDQGTLYFNITLDSEHTITLSETEPQNCSETGGVCMDKPCDTYQNCSAQIGFCSSGYCCYGSCITTTTTTTTTVTTTTSTTTSTTTTVKKRSSGGGGGGGGSGGGYVFKIKATCFDNLKNCHDGSCEEGIDCGGPCKPCPSCSDGIQNQGEEGIDCGGPCPPCTTLTTTTSTVTTTLTTTIITTTTTTTTTTLTVTTTLTTTTRVKQKRVSITPYLIMLFFILLFAVLYLYHRKKSSGMGLDFIEVKSVIESK